MNKLVPYLCAIALCESVGIAGGSVTSLSVSSSWYKKLRKPSFNPPSWVFGPVWITLYGLMGVAVTLAAEKNHRENINAVALFGYQLLLNFLWTILFFGLRNPFASFFELVALLIAVLLTIVSFWRISKKSALLMIPYVLWISFASILNFKIWRLNRH